MKHKESATLVQVGKLHDGQVAIPVEFRQAIGAQPEDLLLIELVDDEIHLKRAGSSELAVINPWFRKLYDYFAPVRAEAEAAG